MEHHGRWSTLPSLRALLALPVLVPLALLSVALVTVAPAGAADTTGYLDVPAHGTHADAIERLTRVGVLQGVTADRFRPQGTLTRGQAATIVDRLLSLPESAGPSAFLDIDGNVHQEAIERARAAGVVAGTSRSRFSPSLPISRAHLATMLVRIDDHAHRTTLAPVPVLDGDDRAALLRAHPDISGHPRSEELLHAVARGYLAGTRDGRLQPDAPVTRAQAATLIDGFHRAADGWPARAADRLGSAPGPRHGSELRTTDVGVRLPAGALRNSGAVTTTRHGQVIEGLDITVSGRGTAGVRVRHDDVVVRDVVIRHLDGADAVRIERGVRGARVEHSTFDAVHMAPTAVGHLRNDDGTYRNNNVGSRSIDAHGQVDIARNHVVVTRGGFRIRAQGSRVRENLVERLFTSADSPGGAATHGTSISLPGGVEDVRVERNRVVAGSSGGIVLYGEHGPLRRITIADNLVTGLGEGMGIYGGRSHLHTGAFREHRDVRIDGNRFDGRFGFPNVLGGGTNTAVDLSRPGNSFDGNRWVGGRADLPARCGIRQDACEQP